MIRARFLVVAAILVASASVHAADWRMDPAASRLTFQAFYQGQAAPGSFKQFDTRLSFDPARPADGKLDVTVKLTSVDMGSTEINEAIREPDWFDLKRYPDAEFSSNTISQNGPGKYIARGVLRIKGTQQQVAVPFNWEASGKTATMTGDMTLKRTAFGIGTGEWASGDMIGLDVKVSFNVRLQRAN